MRILICEDHDSIRGMIETLVQAGTEDQLEVERLKKRKLMLKDQIQLIVDSSIPDIIA